MWRSRLSFLGFISQELVTVCADRLNVGVITTRKSQCEKKADKEKTKKCKQKIIDQNLIQNTMDVIFDPNVD